MLHPSFKRTATLGGMLVILLAIGVTLTTSGGRRMPFQAQVTSHNPTGYFSFWCDPYSQGRCHVQGSVNDPERNTYDGLLYVRLYQGDPNAGGKLIGRATASPFHMSDPSFFSFEPPNVSLTGTAPYQIYALAENVGEGQDTLLPVEGTTGDFSLDFPICYNWTTQCQDYIDNDEDGKIDAADPGCDAAHDPDPDTEAEERGSIYDPTGAIVSSSCETGIKGWACEVDADSAQQLIIRFFGGANQTSSLGQVTTYTGDTHPCEASGRGRNFSFTIPASLRDGQPHSVYVEAGNVGLGYNAPMAGSPVTVQCAALPSSSASSRTYSSSPAGLSCQHGTEQIAVYGQSGSDSVLDIWLSQNTGSPSVELRWPGLAMAGKLPVMGDWWGRGYETLALYDPANATVTYYRENKPESATTVVQLFYMFTNMLPVAGNWGTATPGDHLGLYDPVSHAFSLFEKNFPTTTGETMTAPLVPFNFGGATPTGPTYPVAGGWSDHAQGSPADRIGVYAQDTSIFYLNDYLNYGNQPASHIFGFGTPGCRMLPLTAYWKDTNGRGVDSPALYDPVGCFAAGTQAGTLFVRYSNSEGMADAMYVLQAPANGVPLATEWCLPLGASSSRAASSFGVSSAPVVPGEHHCGNGVKEQYEECESDAECPTGEHCSEECYCNTNPSSAHECYNTIIEPGEDCELSHPCASPYTCNLTTCLCERPSTPVCGDGRLEGSEECDNGIDCPPRQPGATGTVCRACQCITAPPQCGDGFTESYESCDPADPVASHNRCVTAGYGMVCDPSSCNCMYPSSTPSSWSNTCHNNTDGTCGNGRIICPTYYPVDESTGNCYGCHCHPYATPDECPNGYQGLCSSGENCAYGINNGYVCVPEDESVLCGNGVLDNDLYGEQCEANWQCTNGKDCNVHCRCTDTASTDPGPSAIILDDLSAQIHYLPSVGVTRFPSEEAFGGTFVEKSLPTYTPGSPQNGMMVGVGARPGRYKISVRYFESPGLSANVLFRVTYGSSLKLDKIINQQHAQAANVTYAGLDWQTIGTVDQPSNGTVGINVLLPDSGTLSSMTYQYANVDAFLVERMDQSSSSFATSSTASLPSSSSAHSSSSASPVSVCGNGVKEGAEGCDDWNIVSGDGCSATCTQESGWACSGTTSVCVRTCGNGMLETGETCDDGNRVTGDGCSSLCATESGWSCTPPLPGQPSSCTHSCGNGTRETGEGCDDGDTESGDGCSMSCTEESGWTCTGSPSICQHLCGNGQQNPGEQCDDSNTSSGDGCSVTCMTEAGWVCTTMFPSVCATLCGDGRQAGTEQCDDSNTASGDGCSQTCRTESGWTCTGTPSSCCPALHCGDGHIACSGEQCDDGDTNSGDGCTSTCLLEPGWACEGDPTVCTSLCGNGRLDPGEECDDGNGFNGDGCTSSCTGESGWSCSEEPSLCTQSCGNGIIDEGEECDDGNVRFGDGCSVSCDVEDRWSCTNDPSVCAMTCGDGAGNPGEACDDGNNIDGDGCSGSCMIERGFSCETSFPSPCRTTCGDGLQAGWEQCDDSNQLDDDGCSASCMVEAGWTCAGEPAVCTSTCGDGLVVGTEPCDDGNLSSYEGCSNICAIELGWECAGEPSICLPVCGDGSRMATEACDDGDTDPNDGCSATCTTESGWTCMPGSGVPDTCAPSCGDGRMLGTESCDDGNVVSGDGCSRTCSVESGYTCGATPSVCCYSGSQAQPPLCGDGLLSCSGEQCDDRNYRSGDGCSQTCTAEPYWSCRGSPFSTCCYQNTNGHCGDGKLQCLGEECDDGNSYGGDGCSGSCRFETSWVCTGNPSDCCYTGTVNVCGDGKRSCTNEQCDDDNNAGGDGCSPFCTVEEEYSCHGSPSHCQLGCGDGAVAPEEQCDDGNTTSGDGCSACTEEAGYHCTGSPSVCATRCGDRVKTSNEACDDGNTGVGDGCSASCAFESGWTCSGSPSVCATTCGDGIKAGAEQCDDHNTANGDGCSAVCTPESGWTCVGSPSVCAPTCGDGIKTGSEQCDDGDTVSGNGCSASCALESGWVCTGTPSSCATICGDGIKIGGEQCDDHNTAIHDGCSAVCTIEQGWTCVGSLSVCTSICGDGSKVGAEQCDDHNTAIHDGCSENCTEESGWTCAGSPSICRSTCGDGYVVNAETCDDNNQTAGDGCSPGCTKEAGWTCSGAPSHCVSVCGDGIRTGTEGCDDGGTLSGDGCSAACTLESGWVCGDVPSHPSSSSSSSLSSGGSSSAQQSSRSAVCGDARLDGTEQCDMPMGVGVSCVDPSQLCNASTCTCFTPDPANRSSCPGGLTCSAFNSIVTQVCASYIPACTLDHSVPAVECGTDCSGFCFRCVIPSSSSSSNSSAVNATAWRLGVTSVSQCAPFCGDGQKVGTEQCDDRNFASGDGCSGACALEAGWTCTGSPSSCVTSCGDGKKAGPEICDDNNTAAGDGCSATCSVETGWVCTAPPAGLSVCSAICGDGKKMGSEQCDDGNTASGDGCSPVCQIESVWSCTGSGGMLSSCCYQTVSCGDGKKACAEACEDGNIVAGDGCSATCTIERGWECPSAVHCQVIAADGIKAGDEQCDDGNLAAGDGCSYGVIESRTVCNTVTEPTTCTPFGNCGNGVLDAGEQCDDGGNTAGDGCSVLCAREPGYACTGAPSHCVSVCGDGIVIAPEVCDDGNATAGDGCTANCTVESGYRCSGTGSTAACCFIASSCGDGKVSCTGEQCDDGGKIPGDGCSASCGVESGYRCTGFPLSSCAPACGDGILTGTEACDDGNSSAGDGCNDLCTIEQGWVCYGAGSLSCRTVCGDGMRVPGKEDCDSGIPCANGAACPTTCICPGGAVSSRSSTSAASAASSGYHCGNNIVEPGEQCETSVACPVDYYCSACRCFFTATPSSVPTPTTPTPWTPGVYVQSSASPYIPPVSSQPYQRPSSLMPPWYYSSSSLSIPRLCGNAVLDPGEQCDDGSGNAASPDKCRPNCTVPRCGDGITDGNEQCDDGNAMENDGCTRMCIRNEMPSSEPQPGQQSSAASSAASGVSSEAGVVTPASSSIAPLRLPISSTARSAGSVAGQTQSSLHGVTASSARRTRASSAAASVASGHPSAITPPIATVITSPLTQRPLEQTGPATVAVMAAGAAAGWAWMRRRRK